MEPWAERAMERWPNVPVLFGWLGLDSRGRWLIKGEIISRPQIVDTINRNYETDEHGRWFFQNGPQRGFVTLANTPIILRVAVPGGGLVTHTDAEVTQLRALYMDERGGLMFLTEHGPGLLLDADLDWALAHMAINHKPVTEEQLEDVLELPSGASTGIRFQFGSATLAAQRLDSADAPAYLNFVRDPQPLPNERVSTRMAD
jgi:Protein of unknown function (DUF2946)